MKIGLFCPTFPTNLANRRAIRATISLDIPMSEVRRKKGPIYDVLIEELFEINCLYMAAMFSKLVAQEIRLMNGLIINYTLKEKPNLLLGLFDKFKAAELAYIQKKDQSIIFAQSCEALVLLEKSVRRYRWLLVEIYKIVLNLCEKVPSTSYKTNYEKCRIFYNYGMYVLTYVGIEEHLGLFVQGLAMLIECLMADNKYEDAWEQLEFLSTYVNPNEDRQSQKNLCIYKYLKGILLMHYQKLKEAVEELTQAEKISVRQSFKTLQAHTLTQLGNVFSKMTCSYEAQRLYHRKAQKVYKEINEPLRAKGAFYKCIEAKMNEIFPTIKHTIKQSATVDVQMHRLRHWKLGCVHFWEDIPRMVKQDNGDKLLFLLEEI
ncbi:hypothetical protein GQX74_001518 [Glossina fuscipes]|nr:hypothetical protein GQX74_001518 [Glossina fuscipes]